MWIEELPSGKFKFIERYKDAKTGRFKRVSVTLDRNTSQSRNHAQRTLNERIRNTTERDTEKLLTLGALYQEMHDHRVKTWSLASIRKSDGFYRRYLKPYPIHDYLIERVTFKDLQSHLDEVQKDRNLSAVTMKNYKSHIGLAYKYALLAYNIPCKISFSDLTIKEGTRRRKKKKILSSSEIPLFLKKIHEKLPKVYANAIEFQLLTGMRIGEIRALTFADIKGKAVNITKSIERMTNNVVPPKTKSSYRTIYLNERALEIIHEQEMIATALFGEDKYYLFPSKHNGPITYTYLVALLRDNDFNIDTHALRHTHITLLVEKGFDLKYIMERVGHSNPKTTLDVYTHITKDLAKKNEDKLEDLF